MIEPDAWVHRLSAGAKTIGVNRHRPVERLEMELIRRARWTRRGRVARTA